MGALARVSALFLCVWIAACATAPSVPFDKSSANIHSIAIVGLQVPQYPVAYQAATAGESMAAAGGLIGALIGAAIDASVQSNREGKLKKMIDAKGYNAQEAFKTTLTLALNNQGYAVTVMEAGREKPGEYLTRYPAKPDGIDAFLDISEVSQGFMQPAAGAPWRPMVWVRCRLVSADKHDVLMESTIEYNAVRSIKGVVTVAPTAEYSFKDVDAIVADPDKAFAALNDAFAVTASTIGTLLQ